MDEGTGARQILGSTDGPVRSVIAGIVDAVAAPKPRLPITARGLGDPTVAERTDELLDGFGSR